MRERKLDVATVSLALVAEQYFAYVAQMESLEIEPAGEYLVIAATLLFLKSRALLPALPAELVPADEPSAEEVEERLRRRLVLYSAYKGIAEELRARRAEAEAYAYREGGDPGAELVQRYRLDPAALARALVAAERRARGERRVIERERYTLARASAYVVRALRERGRLEFGELCRGLERGAVVATFLAVLELIRRRRLDFIQEGPHQPLQLFAREPDAAA